jgi:chromosome segregation ATPase
VAKVEYIIQEKLLNDSKVRHTEAENVELRTQVRVFKQQSDDYANELQHCQLENAELKTVVSQIQNIDAELARKLEMRTEIIDEQTAEIQKFEAKMQDNVKTVQEMKVELTRLEASTAEAMSQVEELQKENEHKEFDIDNLRVDITEQINQIEKLRVMIQEMDSEISGRDQRISHLDIMNKRLANEMKLLQDLVATANDSSTRFEKQIQSFEERITVMSSSFESLQHDNERLLSDKSRLMQENSRLQSQVETVTEERKRLEDEQDMLEKSLIAAFEEKLAIAESNSLEESLRCAALQKQLDARLGEGKSDKAISGDGETGDSLGPPISENAEVLSVAIPSANEISVGCVERDNTQTSGAMSEKQIDDTVSHLKRELQGALDKNRELSGQLDGLKDSFRSFKQECAQYEQNVTSLERERNDVRSEFSKLNSVIENICEENKKFKTVLSDKDNEVLELSQMISDLEEEKVKLTQTMLEMHTSREELENQLITERDSLHNVEMNRKKLQWQLADLRHCAKTETEKLQEKCDELVKKMLEVTKENEDMVQKFDNEVLGNEALHLTIKHLEEKLASNNMAREEEVVAYATGELMPDGDDKKILNEEKVDETQSENENSAKSDGVNVREQVEAGIQNVKADESPPEENIDEATKLMGDESLNVKVSEAALIESLEDEILALKQQNYDMEISLKVRMHTNVYV